MPYPPTSTRRILSCTQLKRPAPFCIASRMAVAILSARSATGLYHTAILYPTRASLADALRRVLAKDLELEGASDHGVSEAIYLRDPDDNGVELYWDRPPEQWPRAADGGLAMFTRPLDLEGLLREATP